jgi:drug/metabolite transporter (DMT)-like permease
MPIQSWLAVFTITIGLALVRLPFGSDNTPHEHHTSIHSDAEIASRTTVGFFITLLGTAIFSGVYTLNDAMLSSQSRSPPRLLIPMLTQ